MSKRAGDVAVKDLKFDWLITFGAYEDLVTRKLLSNGFPRERIDGRFRSTKQARCCNRRQDAEDQPVEARIGHERHHDLPVENNKDQGA